MTRHDSRLHHDLAAAVSRLHDERLVSADEPPRIGVVLGSGLSAVAERLTDRRGRVIDYGRIPGMPQSGVVGHRGRLVVGELNGQPLIALQGRVHSYEGCDARRVTFGVRLLAALGVRQLVLTNAAGGIRSEFRPGDLMVITGHLQFPWRPLPAEIGAVTRGAVGVAAGTPWDPRLADAAAAAPSTLTVHRGTYAMMAGPSYETPAEIRMLRTLGADAVGMSTVPEALWAASAGLNVLGVSCITNVAAGLSDQVLDHAEVSHTAGRVESQFADWLLHVVRRMLRETPGACRPEAESPGD